MPIDYRLIGDAAAPSGFSPLKALANADIYVANQQKQREAQQKAQEQEAAKQREAMISQTVQQFGGDLDQAIEFLKTKDWQAAEALRGHQVKQRKEAAEQRKLQLDNDLNELTTLSKLVGDGSESNWRVAGQWASQRDPELAPMFQTYDPVKAKQFSTLGMTGVERLKAEKDALDKNDLDTWAKLAAESADDETEAAAMKILGPKAWQEAKIAARNAATAEQNATTSRMNAEKSPAERSGSDYSQFLARYAAGIGKSVDQLTAQEEIAARKQFSQADDSVRSSGGGVSTLSPTAESNIINRMTTQWATAKKPAEELARAASLMNVGMEQARKGNLAAGSQAVLVTFQKILDPTSVVRESEYERSSSGQSLLNRIRGARDRLVSGGVGVPLTELEKFKTLADEAVKAQTGAYLRSTKERIGRTADRYKIPRDVVFEDVDVTTGPAPAAATTSGPAPTGRYNPATGKVEAVK